MKSFKVDVHYVRELAGAGMNGIAAARREFKGRVFDIPRAAALWTPAAVCAGIGIMSAGKPGQRSRPVRGLVGSLIGTAAMLAWSSRRFSQHATGQAIRSVNARRDQHWLAANPIDYA